MVKVLIENLKPIDSKAISYEMVLKRLKLVYLIIDHSERYYSIALDFNDFESGGRFLIFYLSF